MEIDFTNTYSTVLFLAVFGISYVFLMKNLLQKYFSLRNILIKGPITPAKVVKHMIRKDMDGRDAYMPVIDIKGIGEFELENLVTSNKPIYRINEIINIHLDKKNPGNSLIQGSHAILIFELVLLLFGLSPVLGYFIYFSG